MFNFDNKSHEDALDEALSDLLEDLQGGVGTEPEHYTATAENFIKLYKLKKETNPSWRPSPDAIIAAGGSVLTVLLILHYEKLGVVTSKALSFVGKLR